MNEFFNGSIVGLAQTMAGHPFDTLKTLSQLDKIKELKGLGIKKTVKQLYRGMQYPFVANIFYNSMIFGSYDYFYKKCDHKILAGTLTGIPAALMLGPIEYFKIHEQSNIGTKIKYDMSFIKNSYRGLGITVCREMIALSIYFSSYKYFKERYNPILSGGLAGCVTWAPSYPFDVIKTRLQSGMASSYAEVFKQGHLMRGFGICMVRAFILNAAGFYAYEWVKK